MSLTPQTFVITNGAITFSGQEIKRTINYPTDVQKDTEKNTSEQIGLVSSFAFDKAYETFISHAQMLNTMFANPEKFCIVPSHSTMIKKIQETEQTSITADFAFRLGWDAVSKQYQRLNNSIKCLGEMYCHKGCVCSATVVTSNTSSEALVCEKCHRIILEKEKLHEELMKLYEHRLNPESLVPSW